MAYIVKAQGVAAYSSPLVKADFGRQKDVYKLALMGSGDCLRLWRDFEREQPGMARLVKADCESDAREVAEVVKGIDKRLRQAEKVVTKGRKPKVTKARRRAPDRAQGGPEHVLAAWLNSSNPTMREAARSLLSERRGRG